MADPAIKFTFEVPTTILLLPVIPGEYCRDASAGTNLTTTSTSTTPSFWMPAAVSRGRCGSPEMGRLHLCGCGWLNAL
jgi:hypothetical protein